MKKIIGIYKITSPSSKIYIGQSRDCMKRMWYYKRMYCSKQTKLHYSLQKYGWDKHVFEVIHQCTQEELNELEVYYIDLFQCFNTHHGLNLRSGGNASEMSDETKKKLSIIKKDKFRNDAEFRDKLIKQLTSINRDGENNPNYGKGQCVYQFDLNGRFVRVYSSASMAAKINNLSSANIYRCCDKKKRTNTVGSSIWRYSEDFTILRGVLQENVRIMNFKRKLL